MSDPTEPSQADNGSTPMPRILDDKGRAMGPNRQKEKMMQAQHAAEMAKQQAAHAAELQRQAVGQKLGAMIFDTDEDSPSEDLVCACGGRDMISLFRMRRMDTKHLTDEEADIMEIDKEGPAITQESFRFIICFGCRKCPIEVWDALSDEGQLELADYEPAAK